MKINRNGILAGRILTETSFFGNTWKYQMWTFVWWLVIGAAAFILFAQAMQAAKSTWELLV